MKRPFISGSRAGRHAPLPAFLALLALVSWLACDDPAGPKLGPGPESVPARIVVGQVVEGEAIDGPGDVDEFTFTTAYGQGAGVCLRRIGTDVDTLEMRLWEPGRGYYHEVRVAPGGSLDDACLPRHET